MRIKFPNEDGGVAHGANLPTPDESWRFKTFVLEGGTLTPDLVYICLKDYQDQFRWFEMLLLN